jgi:3-oxoacyl-(acyl-carrier-protein) synthase
MRFRLLERADHALRRGKVEQILGRVGPACDGAKKKAPGPIVKPKQTQDRAKSVNLLWSRTHTSLGKLGSFKRLSDIACQEQAFGAKDERNGPAVRKRDRTFSADDCSVWTAALQCSFRQQ